MLLSIGQLAGTDVPYKATDRAQHSTGRNPEFVAPRAGICASIVAVVIFASILLIGFFCFLEWRAHNPLNYLSASKRDVVEKVSLFINNTKSSPECLLIGSSVFLQPIVYGEQQRLGKNVIGGGADYSLRQKILHCDKAPDFEQALRTQLKSTIATKNLSLAAANVSDYLAEIRLLHERGFKPKVIVCGLGVRDFVFNYFQMNANNNPMSELSANLTKKIPVPVSNLSGIISLLPAFKTESAEFFWRQPHLFLSEAQAAITKKAPKLRLPLSIEEMLELKKQHEAESAKQADFIEGQLHDYEALLSYCRENSIPLIIAQVPTKASWAGATDDETLHKIESTIQSGCVTNRIPYFDLRRGFNDSDFDDQVHPSPAGGKKLFERLAASVAQSGMIN